MERSFVFVGCAIIAVFVKKSTRLVACAAETSYLSAETSDQLICRGVGQKVSPRERIGISSVVKEQLDRLITEE